MQGGHVLRRQLIYLSSTKCWSDVAIQQPNMRVLSAFLATAFAVVLEIPVGQFTDRIALTQLGPGVGRIVAQRYPPAEPNGLVASLV